MTSTFTAPVTRRCNAAERQAFKAWWPPLTGGRYGSNQVTQRGEPALGTLEERLSIIIQRLGGTTGAVRMSANERLEYARWQAREGIQ